MEKYSTAGEATDDMTHAQFTLGTKGYRHTRMELCNYSCFCTEQWLHEGAAMLRYTYTGCRVLYVLLQVKNYARSKFKAHKDINKKVHNKMSTGLY